MPMLVEVCWLQFAAPEQPCSSGTSKCKQRKTGTDPRWKEEFPWMQAVENESGMYLKSVLLVLCTCSDQELFSMYYSSIYTHEHFNTNFSVDSNYT